MNENQHDDTSDTGDLRDDADEKTDTDRDVAELLQLSRGSPPDMIRSNIFSFQRFAKRCILIIATTVDPTILKKIYSTLGVCRKRSNLHFQSFISAKIQSKHFLSTPVKRLTICRKKCQIQR